MRERNQAQGRGRRSVYSRGNELTPAQIVMREFSSRVCGDGPFGRMEIAMTRMMAYTLLVLCSCASSTRVLARREDSLAGRWRGELVKGVIRSPADFEFAGQDGDYRGLWQSPAATVTLSKVELGTPLLAASGGLGNVQLGSSIRFEMVEQGSFEGMIRGETIEGTFRDKQGGGWFKLEKQPELKDARQVPSDGSSCELNCGLGDG